MNTVDLPSDPAVLKAMLADKDTHIAELEERIKFLQSVIFQSSSEKKPKPVDESQFKLFDEAELTVSESAQDEEAAPTRVAGYSRRKRGRVPLPAHLPRVEQVIDIPESDKTCACGCRLSRIGEEVSEKLDYVPAKAQVIRYVRPKYACRNCEGTEDDGPTVKTAPMVPQVIPQGIVTPGLLAHVITSKFVDGLPFYRQEKIFARKGLDISRATMCSWVLRTARACAPLIEHLHEHTLSGPVLNVDETTVQVMGEPGRKNISRSYMWLARGGPPGQPGVLFRYSPSRSGKVAEELVRGFSGYLQTDGYAGYNALGERDGIIHVGCLAHVRRKFMDVLKASPNKKGTAREIVDLIGYLYGVEKKAKQNGLSPDEILRLRQERSRPTLDTIRCLLLERQPTTPPRSLLGRALSYALGQWRRVEAYTESGHVLPDNNLAENAIRPFAVGRKNWLFSGSPAGAHASATLFSLVETAKANGLEPYAYLRWLFEALPHAKRAEEVTALLPHCIERKPLRPSQTKSIWGNYAE